MKTIQMTIDESLLRRVDNLVKELDTNRSAFIREALEQALARQRIRRLQERDESGYQAIPASESEIEEWSTEQDWGDPWNEEK